MFCAKCGKQLSDDDNFCPVCGTKKVNLEILESAKSIGEGHRSSEERRDTNRSYTVQRDNSSISTTVYTALLVLIILNIAFSICTAAMLYIRSGTHIVMSVISGITAVSKIVVGLIALMQLQRNLNTMRGTRKRIVHWFTKFIILWVIGAVALLGGAVMGGYSLAVYDSNKAMVAVIIAGGLFVIGSIPCLVIALVSLGKLSNEIVEVANLYGMDVKNEAIVNVILLIFTGLINGILIAEIMETERLIRGYNGE